MKRGPVVLCIGGWDPSGRAGLLADLWAVGQLRAEGVGVVTALTAQGAQFRTWPVSPRTLRLQLAAVFDARRVAAIKIGMVGDRKAMAATLSAVAPRAGWVVIDPVVRTSRGQRLSSLTPRDFLRLGERFGAKTRLVLTPNADELAWLGVTGPQLLEAGFWAAVIKGGSTAVDRVYSEGAQATLRGQRLPRSTLAHRGTGCRFASALAVGLGRGEDLAPSARLAKRLVRRFLSTV